MRNSFQNLSWVSAVVLSLVACEGAPADDRALGPDDEAATLSCAAVDSPTPLVAASAAAEAATAVVTLPSTVGATETYRVTLPEGAEGYASLRIATMHNDVALFVDARDMIVNLDPGGISSSLRHGVCPETLVDDYRTHIHAPGDYVLTFSAEGPREIVLVAEVAELGHGGGDGGMHHDHDGGMHHDHDGGAHHDHDGGMHHDHDGGIPHDGGAHHDHDAG